MFSTPRSSKSARASRNSVSAYDDERTLETLEERGFVAFDREVGAVGLVGDSGAVLSRGGISEAIF